jgi:hypothetical protein
VRSFFALPLYAALISTSATASIAFADVTYGELSAGAESVSEQTGVHAEICRDHLLDPALAKMRLPDGYRFATATELAAKDEALAKLLARSPRYASYAVGSLCFMLADAFVVDEVRAHDAKPTAMAFSWARVTPTSDAAPDPRMKGKVSWVQLGSWYSDRGTDRARIRHTDPMAQFVALRVDQIAPDRWRLRMTLPDGVVRADVRVSGPRIRRNAPQPGFMTVLFSGDSADAFAVFTYFGHHHREATGRWTATGRNAFAAAFRIDGEADAFGTVFQDGWQARGGLYRRR